MTRRLWPVFLALFLVVGIPTQSAGQAAWPVTVHVTGTSMTATWGPPPLGSPVAYHVEIVVASSGQTFAIVNVGLATTFNATLPNGTYVLRVRAIVASGTSTATTDTSFGIGAAVSAIAPLAPQDLRATTTNTMVSLAWNINLATAPPTSFIVDVGTAPTLSNLGSFDTGALILGVASALPPPGTYYVRVRARNAWGTSPVSNEIAVTITGSGQCTAPPFPPAGLAGTVVGGFASLSWFAPLTTPVVTGYLLEVGSAPGLSNIIRAPLGLTTVIGSAVTPGVYYARVRSLNACGQSAPSNEVAVIVP
jgi:predicted phage tail protein